MNETIRLPKSHFLFAVLMEEAIKEADLKGNFITGRWYQVGKTLSLILLLWSSR